jgi:hypothetical protein
MAYIFPVLCVGFIVVTRGRWFESRLDVVCLSYDQLIQGGKAWNLILVPIFISTSPLRLRSMVMGTGGIVTLSKNVEIIELAPKSWQHRAQAGFHKSL